ncbi:MAG TPA: TetR-like C-terminal domain-containing protein [Burkholderiales bacterium]
MARRNRRVPKAPARRPRAGETYHHGALREALLAAAEALLLEQGVEHFTLRECARRAGVSHAAPAHHFGDVRGLLSAFAAIGFERMVALMRRYRAEASPAAAAQLRAVGQAYLDFAVANRAHFQLMFRSDRLDRENPELKSAGQAAFDELRQAMAAFQREYGPADADLAPRLLLAWSVVHGFATLLLENQLDVFRAGRSMAAYARTAGADILGLLGAGLMVPSPE